MKYRILNNIEEAKNAIMIREKVFMQEQGFEDEFDDIDHQALHLELFNEDIPVACARMFTFDNKVYILGRVAVLKEYRKQGIAKKIFKYIIDYAKSNGYKSIHLTCLDTAYNAHKLYESVGMKRANSVKYAMYF